MRLPSLLLAAGLITPALAETLPVPPVPPQLNGTVQGAPIPDIDAHAPSASPADKPSIDVRLYRALNYDPSMGFAPGSRYQSSEDRKAIQTPGLIFTVPLR